MERCAAEVWIKAGETRQCMNEGKRSLHVDGYARLPVCLVHQRSALKSGAWLFADDKPGAIWFAQSRLKGDTDD